MERVTPLHVWERMSELKGVIATAKLDLALMEGERLRTPMEKWEPFECNKRYGMVQHLLKEGQKELKDFYWQNFNTTNENLIFIIIRMERCGYTLRVPKRSDDEDSNNIKLVLSKGERHLDMMVTQEFTQYVSLDIAMLYLEDAFKTGKEPDMQPFRNLP